MIIYFQFPWQKIIFFSFCISSVCFDGLLFSEQRFTELALAINIIRNYSINFYIFLELALKTVVLFLIRVVFFFTFVDCIILFMVCYLYITFKSVFMWSQCNKTRETNKNKKRGRNKKIAVAFSELFLLH